MKTEADLQLWCTKQVKAGEWWEALGDAFQYEPKFSLGMTIPFSCILSREHQVKALLDGKGEGGKTHKLSDSAVGLKPCDAYAMRRAGGWYVLGFNGGNDVVAVDVEEVMKKIYAWENGEIIGALRGSLTLDWAQGCGVLLRGSYR